MAAETIADLLGIRYPIIQGGMAWCSGAKLAAAVSVAGGLGVIGGGSMDADLFAGQIGKLRAATDKPFGVNIPLTFAQAPGLVEVAISERVPVVFTSAGSPKRHTARFKENGSIVLHVVSTPAQAQKCERAGVDGVVAEGFEAGGHLSHEELTTMVLVAQVATRVSIPVIAAGGIACGRQMAAALALGAAGVQIGTRFALTLESSAHPDFKRRCLEAGAAATLAVLKKLSPMRMLENPFREKLRVAEARGASGDELLAMLGEGRPQRGMFAGDLEEGVLEIGQAAGMIDDLPSCAEVIERLVTEYREARATLPDLSPR
ncbi:MAG TPA: nitronate monooxygenase [Myxococcota bacterium]|nr:nitronate monooxygenase [Myxococcota bacterium]